ncbi:thermonuclease family protein [Methylomarinum sp. Ch1-1]|uniref:Thermonuclease family protein n=1 Tax=Methylomarinum roseum TaxID=3067653 RepID=A0AAU7NTH2_9GAMM
MKKRWCCVLGLLMQSVTVSADIYLWVDDQGRRHYSDRPRQGAEVVDLRPGYSYYRVKHVFDGDTVQLMNGQKVRLLGINTPEVDGRYKSAEPGGNEAKRWLSARLANKKIRLETDVEKRDKYRRWLAHLFTEQGQHLNLELVRRGLATVNIHPPNLRYSRQLLAAEAQAEKAGVGLWADPHYARRSYQAARDTRGWQRVAGTVKEIKRTRKNIYLLFSADFAIKIARQNNDLFPESGVYLGRRLEVRGWIHHSGKRYTMPVRHPGSIKLLD